MPTFYDFRRAVVIDCAEIYAGGSDTAMVTSLAKQTGYWPFFTFLNSMNNLVDLASVGLIGQKGMYEISNMLPQLTLILSGAQFIAGSSGITNSRCRCARPASRRLGPPQGSRAPHQPRSGRRNGGHCTD